VNHFFKNIRVINPTDNQDEIVNLWLKDGKIIHCAATETQIDSDTEIIQAEGLVCSPGLLDMHVHLREPGYEYKEDIKSGAAAAANGGFTGLVCMPNTDPIIDEATVVDYVKQKSKDLSVDVHISAAITKKSEGKGLTPMLELDENGVVLFTDDGNCVMDTEMMRRAFEYASTKDLLISQHCEDHSLTEGFAMNEGMYSSKLGLKGSPSVAEEIIVSRDIMLSEYCGNCRYHVSHISTQGSVRLVRDAKARGLRITCEVTPHHFTLTEDLLVSYHPNLKMNPPLRTKEDLDEIIQGLLDGTIDCIASDHAPHALHEKDVEFEIAPNGIIGLETSLALSLTNLVHKNYLSLSQLIEKLSTNPRKVLGFDPISIRDGEEANLTIFDPEEEWLVDVVNFKSKAVNTPYNDMKLKGKPKYAINNGEMIKSSL
jgi:dihydroorotase